jgi:hypothetical protein
MISETEVAGVRYVQIKYGETLQQIAARELGDMSFWVTIANLNGLLSPYITGDHALASSTVALYGASLMVPSASNTITSDTRPDLVFERDIVLVNGDIQGLSGDINTVSGVSNLVQALKNRVVVDLGELVQHTDYGCRARELLGTVGGSTGEQLAGEYVRDSMNQDIRVQEVSRVSVTLTGDVTRVDVNIVPISGREVPLIFQI